MRSLVITFMILASTPSALAAGGGVTVLAGQRAADFHRFTGGKGTAGATGTDVTVSAGVSPFAAAPVSFGLSYSTQTYEGGGSDDLFDRASVTELGPEAVVTIDKQKWQMFARWSQTLMGKLEGEISGAKTLETGAGQTTYTGDSRWEATLEGPHFGAGVLFGNANFGAGVMLDVSFLRTKLDKVTSNDKDVTDSYEPYLKTRSDLQSTALMLALQVRT